MTTIDFTDGSSLTLREAAELIEREGRLGRASYCDGGLRCLVGTLLDAYIHSHMILFHRNLESRSALYLMSHGCSESWNDIFEGTPEERCAHFTALLRRLADEEAMP
jgi:hypothetical protein